MAYHMSTASKTVSVRILPFLRPRTEKGGGMKERKNERKQRKILIN